MSETRQPALIRRLLQADFYPHAVDSVQLLETHISWVFLTGTYAYKLKKPVDLGFLDFSSLEKRKFACEEELRLNARLAPELYIAVVPITSSPERPELAGAGPAIEYAVKMNEFPQSEQLDRLLGAGMPAPPGIEQSFAEFGRTLAEFHQAIPVADAGTAFGEPRVVRKEVLENFRHLEPFEADPHVGDRLIALRRLSEEDLRDRKALLAERKAAGFVREGHGDLHLRNLILEDRRIVPFDCIEFSAELRWIDVINDVAFLFMDLLYHERDRLAYAFLNAWLSVSGDYAGLGLLRLYAAYRAMVRAKIAGIQIVQADETDEAADAGDHGELFSDLKAHLELADRVHGLGEPALLITHGVSGSGKTSVARELSPLVGAIHLRSDAERKRMFGLALEARSDADQKKRIYSRDASERTYAKLLELAEKVLDAGMPVIVDATFLEHEYRERFAALAKSRNLPFAILDCRCDPQVLRVRVENRDQQGRDASEADLAVLERQLSTAPPLVPVEEPGVIALQTDTEVDFDALISRLAQMSPAQNTAPEE